MALQLFFALLTLAERARGEQYTIRRVDDAAPRSRTTAAQVYQGGEVVVSDGAMYRLSERVHYIGTSTGGTALSVLRVAELQRGLVATDEQLQQCPTVDSIQSCVRGDMLVDEALTPFGASLNNEPSPKYALRGKVGQGHAGEVWRAAKVDPVTGEADPDAPGYVLKRIFGDSQAALLSGWREVHFGQLFLNHSGVARYIEHFVRQHSTGETSADQPELWIVFRDEGVSLQRLLLSFSADGVPVPGTFWVRLRTESVAGPEVFKSLAWQVLAGLSRLHGAGLAVHRDIKPGNVIVGMRLAEPSTDIEDEDTSPRMAVRIADFGSAVDVHAAGSLYPQIGPSAAEATLAYSPPEVTLSRDGRPFSPGHPASVDSWAVGMTLLELLLGEPPGQFMDLSRTLEGREAAGVNARLDAAVSHLHGDRSRYAAQGQEGADEALAWKPLGERQAAGLLVSLTAACLGPQRETSSSGDASESVLPEGARGVWTAVRDSLNASRRHHHHAHHNDPMPCSKEGFVRVLRGWNAHAQAVALGELPVRTWMGGGGTRSEKDDRQDKDAVQSADSDSSWLLSTAVTRVSSHVEGGGREGGLQVGENSDSGEDGVGITRGLSKNTEKTNALAARPTGALTIAASATDKAIVAAFESHTHKSASSRAVVLTDGGTPTDEPLHSESPRSGSPARTFTDGSRSPADEPGHPVHARHLDVPVPLLGEEGEDLLYRLLAWDPEERLLPGQALKHPYFSKERA